MHTQRHFDPDGACICDCAACLAPDRVFLECTCPDCNPDACGLHTGVLP